MEKSKDIKHYIPLYHGCELQTVDGIAINLGLYYPEVWLKEGRIEANGINCYFPETNTFVVMNFGQCKIRSRPLSDITKTEMGIVDEIVSAYDADDALEAIKGMAGATLYLTKNGFDVFELIESGLAIDKTKQP